MAAATLDETHSWNDAERWMRDGFGRGRCGGGAPAQGRPLAADRQNNSGQWSVDSGERFVRGVAGGNGGSETWAQGWFRIVNAMGLETQAVEMGGCFGWRRGDRG